MAAVWHGQVLKFPANRQFVFLHGHGSDMDGTKALATAAWANTSGFGMIRFDYSGHGRSDGAFLDGTIGRWKKIASP